MNLTELIATSGAPARLPRFVPSTAVSVRTCSGASMVEADTLNHPFGIVGYNRAIIN